MEACCGFDSGAVTLRSLESFEAEFSRVQDNCTQTGHAYQALRFVSPNNQLRSASAHQPSVISIHNNTAALEMWQEVGVPKCKRIWREGGEAAL